MKGWYDRESGGWMLRSAEDAKAFAEDVAGKSEDENADEAPLSMAEMEKQAPKPTEQKKSEYKVGDVVELTTGDHFVIRHIRPDGTMHGRYVQSKLHGNDVSGLRPEKIKRVLETSEDKSTGAPVKKVDVGGVMDALKQKGETKLSDHAEPTEQPKPKKRRWISDEDADEFNSLRNSLRNHFGKGDDIVQEGAEGYGKPQPKQMDAEVLRMGTRMTYLMMKGGLRSFADYCEAMKDEPPDIFDEMRPHLKSLYAAATEYGGGYSTRMG